MRIGLLMLLDALLISASLLMGLQVYYDMHAPAAHILHVWRSLPLLIVSTVALLHMMGFYRGILKYAGVDLLLQIACGTLGGTGNHFFTAPFVMAVQELLNPLVLGNSA